MKHLIFPLATTTTTLLLLLHLLLTPPTTTATDADTIVYDVIGEPLNAGQSYYIVPYNYEDTGGGFTWKQKSDLLSVCPHFYVIQLEDNREFGEQTAFYPLSRRVNQISLSTKLNIAFPKVSPPASLPFVCTTSSNIWKVAPDANGILRVELGGSKGGRDESSLFTIEELGETEGGYKINYCPKNGKANCGALGIVSHEGGRWLGVNGTHPLAFAFENESFFLQKA